MMMMMMMMVGYLNDDNEDDDYVGWMKKDGRTNDRAGSIEAISSAHSPTSSIHLQTMT